MSADNDFESELNLMVREYLLFITLDNTTKAFDKECIEKGKDLARCDEPKKQDHKLTAVKNDLLKLFTLGKRKKFFKIWNEFIPDLPSNESLLTMKIEFYMNIYFALFPIRNGDTDEENSMSEFKDFIQSKGATLSQTTEFLPFYALPFVPSPMKHPSYQEYFTDRWSEDMKVKLEKFLNLTLNSSARPRLLELYNAGDKDKQIMKKQISELDKQVKSYHKRYTRMQNDYQNLIEITADLLDTLEATLQGERVSPEFLTKVCKRLFSDQIKKSVDLSRPGTAANILRKSTMPPQGLLPHETVLCESSLDFDKIKQDLIVGSTRTRLLLLQALRWKLTKTSPSERDTTLSSFISHDLLGCTRKGTYREAILHCLKIENESLREYLARLLNAFASLSEGRSYLSQNPQIVPSLIENLKSEEADSLTRENILGCLQKLSMRKTLQNTMIEANVINWLIQILEDYDSLSDYTLEYSVALLMNLCLRTAGKLYCEHCSSKVLQVLSDLLGHENPDVIPYVNGTLYSILNFTSIREEAKAMDMEGILKCFLKADQPDLNRQIGFIIAELNSTEAPKDSLSDNEEDDDDDDDAEQDAMESDLDKREVVKPVQGELYGNRLLNTVYNGVRSSVTCKKKHIDHMNENVLVRPITPSHRRGSHPIVHTLPRSGGSIQNEDKISRPFTQSGSRPSSSQADFNRPPTRSGSSQSRRQSSSSNTEHISCLKKDVDECITNAEEQKKKASKQEWSSKEVEEMDIVFGTKNRIPRTPDIRQIRGSIAECPAPTPKYSNSLPSSRPSSGNGRPSSVKKINTPPGSRGK